MAKKLRISLVALLLLALVFSTVAVVAGCGSTATTSSTETTASTPTQTTSSAALGDRAIQVLASSPTSGDYPSNSITGSALSAKLQDPAQAAGIYLLDVRKASDFAAGHIQGANQVEFAQWAAPDNLSKLPKDKKIVVICYTGNTAAQTVSGLRMLGYDAAALKGGINGWAQNQTQATVTADLNAANYPTVTTPNPVTPSPAPTGANFNTPPVSSSDYTAFAQKANDVFTKMPTSGDYANYTISPATLSAKLADPTQKNTLFVLDVRAAADYATAHIDGASNIPFASVAVPANLQMLPKDKKIVVVCYTGNTAAQATTILNMLGYDAVVLKYGMMGWNGTGKAGYLADLNNDYPLATGAATTTTTGGGTATGPTG